MSAEQGHPSSTFRPVLSVAGEMRLSPSVHEPRPAIRFVNERFKVISKIGPGLVHFLLSGLELRAIARLAALQVETRLEGHSRCLVGSA